MPDKAYEEARSLWEKYRMLTHELMKFIDEEEVDIFLDLVDQRGQVIMRYFSHRERASS